MIEIYDPGIEEKFISGDVVFIIRTKDRDLYMVTTHTDYKKRLCTHRYNPLLFKIDLTTRLAYLYGCLNYSYEKPHTETFTFYYRYIGKHDWYKWFDVKPEADFL